MFLDVTGSTIALIVKPNYGQLSFGCTYRMSSQEVWIGNCNVGGGGGNKMEDFEDTAEDLLIDLEQEMDRTYPWACPPRVKSLLAKVAHKVHKEKDPGEYPKCTNIFVPANCKLLMPCSQFLWKEHVLCYGKPEPSIV